MLNLAGLIKGLVDDHQGLKGTELVLKLSSKIYEENFFGYDKPVDLCGDILQELEKLVVNGELVEIEYVLPTMEYRVKSFYLPKNTEVNVLRKC